MQLSLSPALLSEYLFKQLSVLYPDQDGASLPDVGRFVHVALERVETCFSRITAKGYADSLGPRFNHRHSDQYAVFLYFVSNSAWRLSPGDPVAEKAYGLNKCLHSLDAFYEVELPEIFMVVHPVGTVLGRANYSNYFCAYQNVTVGSNLAGQKPSFGEAVVLYGGSRIIGRTSVGGNTMVSACSVAMDETIPDNSLVFGVSPNITVKANRRDVRGEIFGTRT